MKTNLKKWITISTKRLHTNPYVSLDEDVIGLPSGRKSKYYITNRSRVAVVIVATDKKGRFLLQKEFRYPLGKVIYEFPGGLVKKNETPLKAAKREFFEETGFRCGKMNKLGDFFAAPSSTNVIYYSYHASDLIFEGMKPDVNEYLEHEWVSKKELRRMIKNGTLKVQSALATLLLYFQNKI